MSKITFRADEDLVERIEGRDASKSEIMREALREYLDDSTTDAGRADANADRARDARSVPGRDERRSTDSLDAVLAERVDELVAERLAAWETRAGERGRSRAQDVNVNVTLESDAPVRPTAEREVQRDRASDGPATSRPADSGATSEMGASNERSTTNEMGATSESESACGQCGESLSDDHVYCPNCGEKASHRVFCECGDEVRSDWGFCPSCGRRTPAADVLDQS
jgi:Arc/MetJ-type ribon-helix-helix transcriptional regulator